MQQRRLFSVGLVVVVLTLMLAAGQGATAARSMPGGAVAQAATVYYVDAVHGSDSSGDGSQAAPWQTITHALAQVTGPDVEVHVAPGLYDQALGEVFPIVMDPGVSLIGAGYETTTIVGNTVDYVVYFEGIYIYDETTAIRGFKIMNGLQGIRVNAPDGSNTTPLIEDNWITGNTDGIYVYASMERLAQPLIRNNLITENAESGIYNWARYGGPLVKSVIEGNQILDNGTHGIVMRANGSDYTYEDCFSSPTVRANLIAGNAMNGVLCATWNTGACEAEIVGNVIVDNGEWGIGRVYDNQLTGSAVDVVNNLVAGNTLGGALFAPADQPLFINDTIADNGAYGIRDGTPTLVNSIVWGQADDLNVAIDHVFYSDIGESAYSAGNHNLWADPLFVAPQEVDYHLQAASPVIEAGDNSHPALPVSDLDGDPRLIGGAVDMGADEFRLRVPVYKAASADPVAAGGLLTYTLYLTNTTGTTLTATITDSLPARVTPGGVLTWTLPAWLPGAVWTQVVPVAVEPGWHGVLTNVVEVRTEEHVSGAYSCTVQVEEAIVGLEATNNSPTLLGNVTLLTATIAAGSNVSYTWAFDDGTVGSGPAVAHVYPEAGVYHATVIATNALGSRAATTTVTITLPHTHVYLPLVTR